jgi:probable rRNA maturation factor
LKETDIEKIKNDILGKPYELSFAFIDKKRSRFLNKTYRKKDEPTDILSFPLEKDRGEILICKEIAKKKAKDFYPTSPWLRGSFANYLLFLVIHGNLHLKGMKHGDKMERYELNYYSRYRRRHLRSASSSRAA